MQRKAGEICKTGDIVCSTWGYEQTNVNFYQVVKVSGQMATLQAIGSAKAESEWSNNDSWYVVAAPSVRLAEPFKRKIKVYGNLNNLSYGFSINSYSYASLWNGKPVLQTSYY